MKLEDLKELERRATKAPWSSMSLNGNACVDAEVLPDYMGTILKGSSVHDGRLSATLRNLIPEIIALVEATDEEAYDHGEPCDNEPGAILTNCQCGVCRSSNAFNLKLASL